MKKRADNFKRIGLVAHPGKVTHSSLITRAAGMIRASGREVFVDATTAACTRVKAVTLEGARELVRVVDLLLVFGGDGTMLGVAREIAGSRTPMLGINIGGLGFLTAVPSDQLATALRHVWSGSFNYESRALIEVRGRCNGHRIVDTALNDIVVSRGHVSRLIELEVSVNREPLTRYRCDGLIISSPTGSTAYSLAAGGALVFPTADVFQLTPISPHTLTNRSLILPLDSVIHVTAMSPKSSTILSADGEVIADLDSGDTVTVRRSRSSVRLMHLANSSFFEALRRKLHWRGANV